MCNPRIIVCTRLISCHLLYGYFKMTLVSSKLLYASELMELMYECNIFILFPGSYCIYVLGFFNVLKVLYICLGIILYPIAVCLTSKYFILPVILNVYPGITLYCEIVLCLILELLYVLNLLHVLGFPVWLLQDEFIVFRIAGVNI